MSVLIKGMEMPTCCEECRLWVDRWCYATEERGYEEGMVRKKPDWCPLVEVPKHGRLIDADKMVGVLLTVDPQFEGMIKWSITVVEAQPTIIEAEGGE